MRKRRRIDKITKKDKVPRLDLQKRGGSACEQGIDFHEVSMHEVRKNI